MPRSPTRNKTSALRLPSPPRKTKSTTRVKEGARLSPKALLANVSDIDVMFDNGRYAVNVMGKRRIDFEESPWHATVEAIIYNSILPNSFVYPLTYIMSKTPTLTLQRAKEMDPAQMVSGSRHGQHLLEMWEHTRRANAPVHIEVIKNGGDRKGGVQFYKTPQKIHSETLKLNKAYHVQRTTRDVTLYHWIDNQPAVDALLTGDKLFTNQWLDCHSNPFWVWTGAAKGTKDHIVRLEIRVPRNTPVAVMHRYDPFIYAVLRNKKTNVRTIPGVNSRDFEFRIPMGSFKKVSQVSTRYFDAAFGTDSKVVVCTVEYAVSRDNLAIDPFDIFPKRTFLKKNRL